MTERPKRIGKNGLHWLRTQRQCKLVSWAVIATLLLNILSVSVLLGLSSGEAYAAFTHTASENVLTVCTPDGIKLVHFNENGEPEPIEDVPVTASCVFCLLFHSPILSVPVAGTVVYEHNVNNDPQPLIREVNHAASFVTVRPLGSRAPPVCS